MFSTYALDNCTYDVVYMQQPQQGHKQSKHTSKTKSQNPFAGLDVDSDEDDDDWATTSEDSDESCE